jgi:hypothetical protein
MSGSANGGPPIEPRSLGVAAPWLQGLNEPQVRPRQQTWSAASSCCTLSTGRVTNSIPAYGHDTETNSACEARGVLVRCVPVLQCASLAMLVLRSLENCWWESHDSRYPL